MIKKNIFFIAMFVMTSFSFIQASSAEDAKKDTESSFVNPIFYETMEPISKEAWKTKITPNQIEEESWSGFKRTHPCKLRTNKDKFVAMWCLLRRPDSQKQYEVLYAFELVENASKDYTGVAQNVLVVDRGRTLSHRRYFLKINKVPN